jgi:hypothetical protein
MSQLRLAADAGGRRLPGRAGGYPPAPQTRTCAINAYGSSVTRVLALLWRITVLPCIAGQMLWAILGVGRTYVSSSFWNFSQRVWFLLLRRLSQYRHAFSA